VTIDQNTLEYTIRSFDATTRQIEVSFADGHHAIIQLRTPLPANKAELESIIKTFSASQEVIEARTTSVDLSYISKLVNVTQTCERYSVRKAEQSAASEAPVLDPEADALLVAAEEQQFRNRVLKIINELNQDK